MRGFNVLITVIVLLIAFAAPAMADKIHQAIIDGDVDLVMKMLKKDPSLVHVPDQSHEYDYLPLHFAAVHGEMKIAKFLLKAGAEIDSWDSDESTPLHVAALSGQRDMVAFLLKNGANVNRRDKNGGYGLSFAVSGGDSVVIQQMLGAGADLNYLYRNGVTMLHMACNRGLRDLFHVMMKRGLDINATTNEGETPLHWAMSPNGVNLVEEMLEMGADVNAASDHAETPLLRASFRGCPDAAGILLAHGADPNLANEGGWTPLLAAAREESPEMVQLLIKHGANLDIENERGQTPLMLAAENGRAEAVRALLGAGARTESKETHFGRSAMHVAATKGYKDVVQLLLDTGASFKKEDSAGDTPVALAAYHGHRDVVDLLTATGAGERNLDPARACLVSQKRPSSGEAVIWYLGHSGWAIKTRDHLLVFDYSNREREPAHAGLCNGFISCAELAGENVTVFASHVHGDHYDPAVFGWREHLPNVTYVLGCQPEDQSDYIFTSGRDSRKIDGMKVSTIESNDTGVGFVVEVDDLVIMHPGDHANRQRDFSGPFRAEIDYLSSKGMQPDIAFMPISGCGFGDQEAVKMGVHYTLETLKPRVFIPMHGGNASFRYHEFIAECKDQFPDTKMEAPIDRGDFFRYRDGEISERLALR